MAELGKTEILAALTELGARAIDPVRIVLGGSAALILVDALKRPTGDGDVILAEPELHEIQPLVRRAADAAGVPQGWLNTSIRSYLDALPPDYADRIRWLPPFRRLTVGLLERRDVLAMKVYAGRPRDFEDIVAMRPTGQELALVRQWDARVREQRSPAPKRPRRRRRP
jgi:hypothetical protein